MLTDENDPNKKRKRSDAKKVASADELGGEEPLDESKGADAPKKAAVVAEEPKIAPPSEPPKVAEGSATLASLAASLPTLEDKVVSLAKNREKLRDEVTFFSKQVVEYRGEQKVLESRKASASPTEQKEITEKLKKNEEERNKADEQSMQKMNAFEESVRELKTARNDVKKVKEQIEELKKPKVDVIPKPAVETPPAAPPKDIADILESTTKIVTEHMKTIVGADATELQRKFEGEDIKAAFRRNEKKPEDNFIDSLTGMFPNNVVEKLKKDYQSCSEEDKTIYINELESTIKSEIEKNISREGAALAEGPVKYKIPSTIAVLIGKNIREYASEPSRHYSEETALIAFQNSLKDILESLEGYEKTPPTQTKLEEIIPNITQFIDIANPDGKKLQESYNACRTPEDKKAFFKEFKGIIAPAAVVVTESLNSVKSESARRLEAVRKSSEDAKRIPAEAGGRPMTPGRLLAESSSSLRTAAKPIDELTNKASSVLQVKASLERAVEVYKTQKPDEKFNWELKLSDDKKKLTVVEQGSDAAKPKQALFTVQEIPEGTQFNFPKEPALTRRTAFITVQACEAPIELNSKSTHDITMFLQVSKDLGKEITLTAATKEFLKAEQAKLKAGETLNPLLEEALEGKKPSPHKLK